MHHEPLTLCCIQQLQLTHLLLRVRNYLLQHSLQMSRQALDHPGLKPLLEYVSFTRNRPWALDDGNTRPGSAPSQLMDRISEALASENYAALTRNTASGLAFCLAEPTPTGSVQNSPSACP